MIMRDLRLWLSTKRWDFFELAMDLGTAESWRKLFGWPSLAGSEAYPRTS
jgi:hypothetical protein